MLVLYVTWQLAREVLDIAAMMVKPGITTEEIDHAVHLVFFPFSITHGHPSLSDLIFVTCCLSNQLLCLFRLVRRGTATPLLSTTTTSLNPAARLSMKSSAMAFPTEDYYKKEISSMVCSLHYKSHNVGTQVHHLPQLPVTVS